MRARPRLAIVTAVGMTMLLVVGCGGSSGDAASGSTAPSAAGSTTATTSAAPSSGTPTSAPAGGAGNDLEAPYTAQEACAVLKEVVADLPTDSISAQLQITLSLANLFIEKPGKGSDGYTFDAITAKACPAEHDKALSTAKIKSFGNL